MSAEFLGAHHLHCVHLAAAMHSLRAASRAFLALWATGTSEALSQIAIPPEPTAAEVAASLRTGASPRLALAVLTQAFGPKPARQLDEIADTLQVIATRFPGLDAGSVLIRQQALTTLLLAGRGENGIVGPASAVPYAGAAARIKRIAEFAVDVGQRAGALSALMSLPNQEANLPFLEYIATSTNLVAMEAVMLLGNQTGPAGRAIARRLFLEKRVVEERAVRILSGIASHYGWQ